MGEPVEHLAWLELALDIDGLLVPIGQERDNRRRRGINRTQIGEES
jgi:hypothetical protein